MSIKVDNFVRVTILGPSSGLANINTSALAIITDEAPIPGDFGTARTYLDALSVAEKIDRAPEEIVIIGVEPEEVSCGLELTGQVKQKVPEVVRQVLEEIKDDIHAK